MGDRTHGLGPVAGMLAVLAATALALALAGRGGERASAPSNESAPIADLAALALRVTPGAAHRVERLRELDFESVPRPEVVSAAELGRLERRELERRHALRGIAADEAAVRIAGLLAEDEELEAATASSEELAAAAYDTRAGRLYVIRDAVSANPALVEFLLAHELTHALEDQHYGLADPAAVRNDDAALARLALAEGSATALMVEYAGRHLSPFELGLAAAGLGEGTGEVPAFVVDQLEWAYLGGMRFVDTLRELGNGWKLVDYALEHRPPASTEQVLHPLKFLRDERPARVAVAGDGLRRRGWRRADAGVVGELATRLMLEHGVDRPDAERAAAGWEGDRYELWRRDDPPWACTDSCRRELVLVIRWRVEDQADARELRRGLHDYAKGGLGASGIDGPLSDGAEDFVLEGGALALATGDETVTAAFAPQRVLAMRAATGRARVK